MNAFTRRDALLAGGLGIGTLVAGCLEENGGSGDDSDGDDSTGGPGDDGLRVTDVETLQLGTARGRVSWAENEEVAGVAYRFDSSEEFLSADSDILKENESETLPFIEETDFTNSTVLLVGTVGPNGCYTRIDVENLATQGGKLTGNATAAMEDEDAEACTDVITYPHALVRVTVEGDVPEDGELTIRSGLDIEETVPIMPFNQEATEVKETTILQLGGTGSQPHWYTVDGNRTGAVYRLDDSSVNPDTDAIVDNEEVETFLDEQRKENALLLQVGSAGPQTNYNQLSFENIALEEKTLTGDVLVKAEGDIGGEALTFPWALVHVDFDGEPPEKAALEITDGWDETARATTEDTFPIDPDTLDGYVQPDGEPEVVPESLSCETEEFERHPQGTDEADVVLGERKGEEKATWALRVDETSYELGETVTIKLTNVSGDELVTGNSSKHNIQIHTESGWQDVRGYDPETSVAYTDEGVIHSPGNGFQWEFELTAEGITSENQNASHLTVCPELQAGRYRFLFWDPAIAVEFDVTD